MAKSFRTMNSVAVTAFLISVSVLAEIGPCRRRAVWDADACYRSEDCAGINTICVANNCTCGENFERVSADNGYTCKPAPNDIDADCTSHCKPPLTCQGGKCKCIRATVDGSKCVINCPGGQQSDGNGNCITAVAIGSSCGDGDCNQIPFAKCIGGTCQCLLGLSQRGNSCVPKCADGSEATKTCKRLFDGNQKMLDAFDKDDTCDSNEYCATFGKPSVGLCCPLRCPYGNAVTEYSCEESADKGSHCPRDTHYCYTIKGFDFSNTLCCPRPCHEPTPLFINDQCYARSFLNDACVANEQCEGGITMACVNGKCQCKDDGFVPAAGAKFPTCQKRCDGGGQPLGAFCKPPSRVTGSCFQNKECPANSECRDGKCQCVCGTKNSLGICSGPSLFSPDSFLKFFEKLG